MSRFTQTQDALRRKVMEVLLITAVLKNDLESVQVRLTLTAERPQFHGLLMLPRDAVNSVGSGCLLLAQLPIPYPMKQHGCSFLPRLAHHRPRSS